MAHKPLSDAEFNAKWIARVRANSIETESGCWLWQGLKTRNGYAETSYRHGNVRIHRKIYEITNGLKLDRWIYACHHCDIRHCINPAHVWTGTPKENQQDMSRKGRAGFQAREYCKNGHEMTPENVGVYPPNYRRSCKACCRIKNRMKLGWTREEAERTPVIPVGVPTKRRYIGAKRASAR